MYKILMNTSKDIIKEIGITNFIIVAFFGLFVYQVKFLQEDVKKTQHEIVLNIKECKKASQQLKEEINKIVLTAESNTSLQKNLHKKINNIEKQIIIMQSIYSERRNN